MFSVQETLMGSKRLLFTYLEYVAHYSNKLPPFKLSPAGCPASDDVICVVCCVHRMRLRVGTPVPYTVGKTHVSLPSPRHART